VRKVIWLLVILQARREEHDENGYIDDSIHALRIREAVHEISPSILRGLQQKP
jgi:hypothetical protein